MEFSFLCFVIYLLPCRLAGAGAWDEGASPLVVIHVAAGPVLKVVQFSLVLFCLRFFFFFKYKLFYTLVCRGTPER